VIQPEWAIECEGLTKDYGTKRAVWDLSLKIPRGCVFALLGRNGCGKTTTIKMLMGLLHPTRGTCRVLGRDSASLPDEVRSRVGYLVEGHPLPRTWRVRQLEAFARACAPRWDAALFARSIGRFEIEPSRRIWSLSRGQRGLVSLALVLAAQPEVLVLDDPSMGLDAVVRRTFLQSMVELIQSEGRTILFASHHLADVERAADRIGIMEQGVLRVDCAVDEFLARVRRVEFELDGPEAPLETMPGLLERERRGAQTIATFVNFDGAARERLASLGAREIEEVPLNLEDAFVAYAGRGARGA
jgi:ABC-2 type transport system ATP-binding protein